MAICRYVAIYGNLAIYGDIYEYMPIYGNICIYTTTPAFADKNEGVGHQKDPKVHHPEHPSMGVGHLVETWCARKDTQLEIPPPGLEPGSLG